MPIANGFLEPSGGSVSTSGTSSRLATLQVQAALYREVIYLIQQGVLSVADAEVAVCYGPGLRWGVMGPSLQWHVGGGQGGIQHYMEHLMGPLTGLMIGIGDPDVTPELKQTIIDGVLQEAGGALACV